MQINISIDSAPPCPPSCLRHWDQRDFLQKKIKSFAHAPSSPIPTTPKLQQKINHNHKRIIYKSIPIHIHIWKKKVKRKSQDLALRQDSGWA